MQATFTESCSRPASTPLRQGDVIEATASTASAWTRHLMIITADCDFANSKNAGRVTCVPLLSADDYLLDLFVPAQRDKIVDRFIREIGEELRRAQKPSISAQRLEEWISEVASVDEVIDALSLPSKEAANVRRACEGIRTTKAPAASVSEAMSLLVDGQSLHANALDRSKLVANARSALSNRFQSTPGDAIFLKSISPGYDEGYFAYLRHIEQVWEPEIALTPTRNEPRYRRIGALSDRYIHAVVQRFALVFMPIGLPPDYEDSRNEYAKVRGEAIL